MLIFLMAA